MFERPFHPRWKCPGQESRLHDTREPVHETHARVSGRSFLEKEGSQSCTVVGAVGEGVMSFELEVVGDEGTFTASGQDGDDTGTISVLEEW